MFDRDLLIALISIFLAYAIFLYSSIRRLRKKLGKDAKPSLWTYANELGGYLVVGFVILIYLVVRFFE